MNIFGVSGLLALLVVVVVLVVLVATAVVTIGRARRLDRLHVRVDGARAALVGVLDRRAAVVRTLAATPSPALAASERQALHAAARGAEEAGDGEDREAAENALTGLLARLRPGVLPGDLAAELADAGARVVVARRVYNDAVRDTRALRGRRAVRLLHLAGTAPFPRYFEIVESDPEPGAPARTPAAGHDPTSAAGPDPTVRPATTGPGPVDGAGPGGGAGAGGAPAARRARDAARVVVLDPHGRVLLLRATGPDADFWFTPGGGVEPGEAPHRAAVRHLLSSTGVHADPDALAGPAWVRDVAFAAEGATWSAHEFFFVLRLGSPTAVDTAGAPPAGARAVGGHRWWTATELTATLDTVHPAALGHLLADPAALDPTDPPVLVR